MGSGFWTASSLTSRLQSFLLNTVSLRACRAYLKSLEARADALLVQQDSVGTG